MKFKDAGLVGIPIRLTMADKALADGSVEFKARNTPGKGGLVPLDAATARCLAALGQ